MLKEDQFKKLDELIQKTGAYTTFLVEQMETLKGQEAGDTDAAVGSKRKGTGAKGSRKRAKPTSDTQARSFGSSDSPAPDLPEALKARGDIMLQRLLPLKMGE